MENARQEFIEHVEQREIKCVTIKLEPWNDDSINRILPIGYNDSQFEVFLNSLDFSYDAGYGGQELYGTIWYKDGTWSERGEYDGSEWWAHKSCPEIPTELK